MKKISLVMLIVLGLMIVTQVAQADDFEILTISPSVGTVGVSTTTPIVVTFSHPLATSTINGHIELRKYDTTTAVSANRDVSGGDTVITLTPKNHLEYSQSYYLFVSTSLHDINDLPFPDTWQKSPSAGQGGQDAHKFTTESAPIVPPDATSTPPEATSTPPTEPSATSTTETSAPRYDASGSYRHSSNKSSPVSVATPKVLGAVTFVASDVPTLGLFATNLGLGSVGLMVLRLQERLVGENLYHGALDSHFGPQLAEAVRAYQLAHELPVTGFVGVLTRAALNAQ